MTKSIGIGEMGSGSHGEPLEHMVASMLGICLQGGD